MIRLFVQSHGRFVADPAPEDIDARIGDPEQETWLDITLEPGADPETDADAALLREEFGFHPLAIADAYRKRHPPKIDVFGRDALVNLGNAADDSSAAGLAGADDSTSPVASRPSPCGEHYFLIAYAPRQNRRNGTVHLDQLAVFIGRNYLVTIHRGEIPAIAETLRLWQIPDSPLGQTTGALAHTLLDGLVDAYFPMLDHIADRLQDLEDAIFGAFDEGLIKNVFSVRKDLLRIRRVLSPMRDIMNVIVRRDIDLFAPDELAYFRDVHEHTIRHIETLDIDRELISGVLESYLSMQSNRLNQIVKVLTVASIILMSNSLVSGIYGMNFRHLPELSWRYGYAFALGLMVVISVGLIVLFRRIRWL